MTKDQLDVEKEDRAVFYYPPFKSVDTTDSSTIAVTLYWKKHVGPAVSKYTIYWWPALIGSGDDPTATFTYNDAGLANLFLDLT